MEKPSSQIKRKKTLLLYLDLCHTSSSLSHPLNSIITGRTRAEHPELDGPCVHRDGWACLSPEAGRVP